MADRRIIKDEPAISGEGAKIALNYKAKGVYLVMKSEGVASTVELLLDGKKSLKRCRRRCC